MTETSLKEWRNRVDAAKFYHNAGRGGKFAVRIALPGLDEYEAPVFTQALNAKIAEVTPDDSELQANFRLQDKELERSRACLAKFHYYADAQECLGLVKKCGLATDTKVSHDTEQFGKEHDQWLKQTSRMQRFFRYGPSEPEFFQPIPQSRTDLVGGGAAADEDGDGSKRKRKNGGVESAKPRKNWKEIIAPAKLAYNRESRGGFIVRFDLNGLNAEEASRFVPMLNKKIAEVKPEESEWRAKFKLRDKDTDRFRHCSAQFDRFADAEACLTLIGEKCGLHVDAGITSEMRGFGRERDQWLDIPWLTRTWHKIAPPTLPQPSFTPRLHLETGEVSDDDDGGHGSSSKHRNEQGRRRGSSGPEGRNSR